MGHHLYKHKTCPIITKTGDEDQEERGGEGWMQRSLKGKEKEVRGPHHRVQIAIGRASRSTQKGEAMLLGQMGVPENKVQKAEH